MRNRSVKKIISSQKVNMGRIYIQHPLPDRAVDQIDPFILIYHGSLPGRKTWQNQLGLNSLQFSLPPNFNQMEQIVVTLKHLHINEEKQIGLKFYPKKIVQPIVKGLPKVK